MAKIEYENRYGKNSKLSKFLGNTSVSQRVRQQFLQLRQPDVRLLLAEESHDLSNPLLQMWLWHFSVPCSSCNISWTCCDVVSWTGCDVLQMLLQLEEPSGSPCAGEGAGQLPGRRAVALGSAGDVGRAALMDSFCHMESHLWLSSLCFCMLQSSHFPNTPYIQVLILHISKPYCWFVLPQLLYKGSDFLDLCLMGFFLGLADFRPHLLNISFPTCTFQWLKILFTEVGCFSLHILHSILSICLL